MNDLCTTTFRPFLVKIAVFDPIKAIFANLTVEDGFDVLGNRIGSTKSGKMKISNVIITRPTTVSRAKILLR